MKLTMDKMNPPSTMTSTQDNPGTNSILDFLTGAGFPELLKANDDQTAVIDKPVIEEQKNDAVDDQQSAAELLQNLAEIMAEITQNQQPIVRSPDTNSDMASSNQSDNADLSHGDGRAIAANLDYISSGSDGDTFIKTERVAMSNAAQQLTEKVTQQVRTPTFIPEDVIEKMEANSIQSNDISKDFNPNYKKLTPQADKLTSQQIDTDIDVPRAALPQVDADRGIQISKLGLTIKNSQAENDMNKVNNALNKWATKVNDKSDQRLTIDPANLNALIANRSFNTLTQADTQVPASVIAATNSNIAFRIDTIETMIAKNHSQNNVSAYHATIQITPVELGPITAKIKVDKNKAILDIMVKDSRVAELVKAHLSELKEQFSQNSMQIDAVNIEYTSSQYQQNQDKPSSDSTFMTESVQELPMAKTVELNEKTRVNSEALIDTYI